MKKIVIIGANDFQNQLIIKAKDMGYQTHVFAWEDGSIGEKTADFFYPISIIEKEAILKWCKEIKPDAVCSIASDLAVVTVNYIAENLGLPGNGMDTTVFTTNKYAMRSKLSANHLPVPSYICVSDENVSGLSLSYPLIVKPTDRSGSRGVTKVQNESELKEALKYAISYSFEHKAIIEEFIEGEEYSCECISTHGQHKLLTITKKFTTGSPHFIETGHLQPCGLSKDVYDQVEQCVLQALDALQITTGASHTEIKINDNGDIGIIEIGARMGGDCIGSDLVLLSTGYDYLKMVLQSALGEPLDKSVHQSYQYAGIKFIFNQEDKALLEKAKLAIPDEIVRVSLEEEDREVTDSSTRLGYFICRSNDYEKINWVFENE